MFWRNSVIHGKYLEGSWESRQMLVCLINVPSEEVASPVRKLNEENYFEKKVNVLIK